MKKTFVLGLLALGFFSVFSVNALNENRQQCDNTNYNNVVTVENQAPCTPAPCDTVPCTPAPCDTVPCTPAPCC